MHFVFSGAVERLLEFSPPRGVADQMARPASSGLLTCLSSLLEPGQLIYDKAIPILPEAHNLRLLRVLKLFSF